MKTITLSVFTAFYLLISIFPPEKPMFNDEATKEELFINCISGPDIGDLGCDSCYYAIYGIHIDTYSLFNDSIVGY